MLKTVVIVFASSALAYGAWLAFKLYETICLIRDVVRPANDKADEFCPAHLTDINGKDTSNVFF